ncbi:diguanylate cyclase [Paludicola sp. MB14-C6]|uniref:sensor domain-containing diguanylate cyclase n=1 Tax=Paludihabitans sp. MB14-C6 TaxID=3070656 RepID=UPI0027DD4154|nr:diguanylate cyclase [Paludicola sp. MB14-C6]WMJ22318.1 diguanylate cyclase [Paludicola sp. MB14-C6]
MHKKQMKTMLSVLAILSTCILFICILFVYWLQMSSAINEESYSCVENLAKQRRDNIKAVLQLNLKSLDMIAATLSSPNIKDSKEQQIEILETSISKTSFKQLGILTSNGDIIATKGSYFDELPIDYYENILQDESEFAFLNAKNNIEKRYIYHAPFSYSNENKAILLGVMDFQTFQNTISSQLYDERFNITITDHRMNPLITKFKNSNNDFNTQSVTKIIESLNTHTKNDIYNNTELLKEDTLSFKISGDKYVMHYTPLNMDHYYIVSTIDDAYLSTDSKYIFKISIIFFILTFVVFSSIIIIIYLNLNKSKSRIHKTKLEFETVMANIPGGVVEFLYDDCLTIKFLNDGISKLIQFSKKDIETVLNNSFLNLVHEKDREQLASAIVDQMTTNKTVEIDCRIMCKDGTYSWFLFKGRMISNTDQNPSCLCVLTDITDKKQVQHELNLNMQRYRVVTEQSDSIIFEYSFVDQSVYLSDKWDNKFSFNSKQPNFIEQAKKVNLVHPQDYETFKTMFDLLQKGKKYCECEVRLAKSPDKYIWCRIKASTIIDENDVVSKTVGKIIDIDQQKRETDMLKQKAENDSLTGLYNKGTTSMLIDNYLTHKGKNGKHTLLFLDIDNFKNVNDTLGHLVGDSVILQVTSKLKKIIRSSDICGRVGGDEFVILLKNTTNMDFIRNKANEICEAFRQTVSSKNISIDISGSIGIAFYDIDGTTFNELVDKADTALYEAKKGGKNQYIIYGGNRIL